MPRPLWITASELGRIQDRHQDIEQDTLPTEQDTDHEEEM